MLDSTESQTENWIVKKNLKSVQSDRKNYGNIVDHEGNDEDGWNESIIDCPKSVEYSRKYIEPFEKDSVFFMDKSVMECELPEIIVCYKESTFHVVKDICVDEGIRPKDKFFENSVDEKSLSTLLPSEKDENTEIMGEKTIDSLKASSIKDCCKDIDNICEKKDLVPTGEMDDDTTETIADGFSKAKISLGDMLAMEKLQAHQSNSKSSNVDSYVVELPSVQRSIGKIENMQNDVKPTEKPTLASASEEMNNDKQIEKSLNDSEESALAGPTQVSSSRQSDGGSDAEIIVKAAAGSASEEGGPDSDDAAYNSKVETGSITFNFDSSAPFTSSAEESRQSTDGLPLESENGRLVTRKARLSEGESSFSMAGPISGSIAYSGPIAYSGSLSHRSDSSTTSTRSFAFPVLQSEWNSSPVRMAKADRRHYRRHRGWRLSVLCCRF